MEQYTEKIISLHIKSQHCRPCESPIEQRHRLTSEDGEFIEDVSQFRSMVGSLVYITITRPGIAYVVGVVSQFMQKPRMIHLDAAYRILRYLKFTWKRSSFPIFQFPSDDRRRRCRLGRRWAGQEIHHWKEIVLSLETALYRGRARSNSLKVIDQGRAKESSFAKYRAMPTTAGNLVWAKSLLEEMDLEHSPRRC